MASKRLVRRRRCGHKRRYIDRPAAMLAAYLYWRDTRDRMQAYRCSFCGSWHLGHGRR